MKAYIPKTGHSVPEFCHSTSIGRSKLYEFMKLGLVKYVKAGRRTIITDDPADFLARLSKEVA